MGFFEDFLFVSYVFCLFHGLFLFCMAVSSAGDDTLSIGSDSVNSADVVNWVGATFDFVDEAEFF